MSLVARLVGRKTPPARTTARRAYSILAKSGSGRFLTTSKPPKALATTSTPGSSTSAKTNSHQRDAESSIETSSSTNVAAKTKADESSITDESQSSESMINGVGDGLAQRSGSSNTSRSDNSFDKESNTSSASVASDSSSSLSQSTTARFDGHETPLPHPRPTQETVSLHSFFSLHRPLLLLPMHASLPIFNSISTTGTILDDPKYDKDTLSGSKAVSEEGKNGKKGDHASADSKSSIAKPARPAFEVELGSGRPLLPNDGSFLQMQVEEEDMPEVDADAARLLGRSYVVNTLGSFVDWQNVLKTLGDSQARQEVDGIKAVAETSAEKAEDSGVVMDSVKRKRKKKMNKHIYKKRRKRERAQRRKLGK
ncbi:hypothetical protein CPB86DRAFT_764984 [Serendipita vermifera]|nr:hypothetical protein CPB86DRAFT_764984 [Serendipita vermifera]